MTPDPNPLESGAAEFMGILPGNAGAGSESDASARSRLVEFLFEHSARPYEVGPERQRSARQRDERSLCGKIRFAQQSIGRIEEVGLHHRSARHVLRQAAGCAADPAPLFVIEWTGEPRLTTPPFLVSPGVNLLLGGRQLRFGKAGEGPMPVARPGTLFLLAGSSEPSLPAFVFALRPLRDVVPGRAQARLGEAQRRTAAVAPCPVVLLVLGWTGEPGLAALVLATGPR